MEGVVAAAAAGPVEVEGSSVTAVVVEEETGVAEVTVAAETEDFPVIILMSYLTQLFLFTQVATEAEMEADVEAAAVAEDEKRLDTF